MDSETLVDIIGSEDFNEWFDASLAKYPTWFPFIQKCADQGKADLLNENFEYFCVDLYLDLHRIILDHGFHDVLVENAQLLLAEIKSRFRHLIKGCIETAETNAIGRKYNLRKRN